MNPSHLRAFHAVATAGGFTTAARALGVTQPTLSAQVKALEQNYGVLLFERSPQGTSLTPLGGRLLELTRRLANVEDQAEELLRATRDLERGTLRVGADGPHHVMPLLARFMQRYPGLEIALEMGNSRRMMRRLLDYQVDVAVLAHIDPDPRLYTRELSRSPLLLLVARTHRWAKRASIRLAEVADERLIVREATSVTRRIFEDALREGGVHPQATLQIETREAVREAVAAGLGVGVVSSAEFDRDARIRALRIRDPGLVIAEHLACLEERRRLRIVETFMRIADG